MKIILRTGEGYALSKHKLKHTTYIRYFSLLAVATIMCLEAHAQSPESSGPVPLGKEPFAEIITDNAKSQYGMLGVHEVGGKTYLEIPDSLLGRDILVINRLSKGWAGTHPYDFFMKAVGYRGDLMSETMIRFEADMPGKVSIRIVNYDDRIVDTHGNIANLPNADELPLLCTVDILERDEIRQSSLIDGNQLLSMDNEMTGFSKDRKGSYKIGSLLSSTWKLTDIRVDSLDLGIRSRKVYASTASGNLLPVDMLSTWFLLSKTPMKVRRADSRVGYFSFGITDYTDISNPPKKISLVKRWRLVPKKEELAAYLRGELVEPERPIVFYIDPAMPREWVPHMIQGINDWQIAFEQAGFKNAIIGMEAPDSDTDGSVADARHSFIAYKPSDITNARADMVVDPRSGEIINAEVCWHHGIIRMLQKWAFVQGALHLPQGQQSKTDSILMGKMIRYMVSHEVGHALGLTHNFGASSATPVEKLRDKEWLRDNAFCPSIMDYARLNYVAQPRDSVGLSGLLPRIGAYDKWAIEWAYRIHPDFDSPEAERQYLSGWTAARQCDGRLWFGGENNPDGARCQKEDLGDDAMAAGAYGIHNLKLLMDSLPAWYGGTPELTERYQDILDQYRYYVRHTAAQAGGSRDGGVFAWLNRELFDVPAWLLKPDVLSATGGTGLKSFQRTQDDLLDRLLGKLPELDLAGMQRALWKDLYSSAASDDYRQQLQRSYTVKLTALLKPGDDGMPPLDESTAIIRGCLRELHEALERQLSEHGGGPMDLHYRQVLTFIDQL